MRHSVVAVAEWHVAALSVVHTSPQQKTSSSSEI